MVRDILPEKRMSPPAPQAAAVPAMIDVTVCGAPAACVNPLEFGEREEPDGAAVG